MVRTDKRKSSKKNTKHAAGRSFRGPSARNDASGGDRRHVFDGPEGEEGVLCGRNVAAELLKSGRIVEKLWVQQNAEGSIGKILSLARERGVPFVKVDRATLDRLTGGAVHQGVALKVSPYEYSEVADILARAKECGEDPFILLLDGVEDPHNFGAILRSAECAGAHGVIVPKNGSAPLSEVVAKASAGAVAYVPVAKVTNLVRTIEDLKEHGLWIAACDMGGDRYYECDLTGPVALVIGGEGKGIGRLVRETCDYVVSMPLMGKINSLNASNAAAIALYEVRRQRDTALTSGAR